MNEDVYTIVQILELTGRGASAFMSGIRLSVRGALGGADLIALKQMQLKMKLHYASTGTHNTMKVKDLEKLTGGQYDILNIPFEDEKSLLGFYDRLKKVNVAFAELPDLNLGDGYTQIAYNPQDADRVKVVVEYYKEKMEIEAAELSLEQYEKLGDERSAKVLNELAEKGYQQESQMSLLQTIRDRNKDPNFIPISIDIDSLLIKEYKDSYECYVPGTYHRQTMTVKKEDCVLLNDRKTIYTHLKREDPMTDKIKGKYNKVDSKHKKQSERINITQTDCLPDFTKGQSRTDSAPKQERVTPDDKNVNRGISTTSNLEKMLLQSKNQTEENVIKALSKESVKEKANSDQYIPVTLDLEKQLVAESSNLYIAKLPEENLSELGEETARLIYLPKNDTVLSADGRQAQIFLEKDGKMEVSLHDVKNGKRKSSEILKNEEIAKMFTGRKTARSEASRILKSPELTKGNIKIVKGGK